jgi:para-aminobenzoate synthetase component 1
LEYNSNKFWLSSPDGFRKKMLNWSKRFNIFCFLENPLVKHDTTFDVMLAAGAVDSIRLTHPIDHTQLQDFFQLHKDWLFGHLNYPSSSDAVDFPAGFFFQPEIRVMLKGDQVTIHIFAGSPVQIFTEINEHPVTLDATLPAIVNVQCRQSRQDYIQAVEALKKHIRRGDCYEVNYCMDFFSEHSEVDPWLLYQQLSVASPNPFAAFYKVDNSFCLCASPERFLRKEDNILTSQPIKGTSRRFPLDPQKDAVSLAYLTNSEKEKSENVMVVDLVRNDLSRICTEGSVKVTELFGIYAFPQLYHLISTVQGGIDENISMAKVFEACFPMGSMTGAPKKRVMELIEEFEVSPRGLFSGTIGYISPDGIADFNVVIRSIFYNTSNGMLSFKAGSGITFYSEPEQEYDECMLKASAIMKMLMSA